MRKIYIIALSLAAVAACAPKEKVLKDVLADDFLIGCALNERQILGTDVKGDSVFVKHFNCCEPENCMKPASVMPKWGEYNFDLADKYVDFAEANGLVCFGHCLIWHSQLTPDFCLDAEGKLLDPETLKARMKQHITTMVSRYKGRIKGWDVVNEAILEDGSYRNSQFYQILGEEFIPWAFQCAHEADPDCELYYNDYSMHEPAKLEAVIKMAKNLQARGLRIDALGFQGHIGMDYPDIDLYESHIRRVKDETGLDVCITELDMSILPTVSQSADLQALLGEKNIWEAMRNPETREALLSKLDPYRGDVPQEVQDAWNARFAEVVAMLRKNNDVIRRVNVWNVSDGDSWKNGFPFPGRIDCPTFVDREYNLKPFVQDIINNAK